ncbi:MAG: hypothetical protein K2F94_03810 [Muribaculaceae bacterium]|nr:hypothetical protein [Muribaculaceae bacterium]
MTQHSRPSLSNQSEYHRKPNLLSMPYSDSSPVPRTVKDLDPDDQPREKAEKHGCSTLSVPDLWAIILRT